MGNEWQDAKTFEQYVISLILKKDFESVEFKTLVRIFGKEKIRKIWKEFRESNDPKDPR